jgi:hypothetical protein
MLFRKSHWRLLSYWVGWPREILHYLAARALGLKAFIGVGETAISTSAPTWKYALIGLAPALFCAALIALSFGLAFLGNNRLLRFGAGWLIFGACLMLAGCYIEQFVSHDLNFKEPEERYEEMLVVWRSPNSKAPRILSSKWLRKSYGRWLIYLFGWPHEIIHYLAARAVGVTALIGAGVTYIEKTSKWKRIFIALAPAGVFTILIGIGVGVTLFAGSNDELRVYGGLMMCGAILPLFSCYYDMRDAWHIAHHVGYSDV